MIGLGLWLKNLKRKNKQTNIIVKPLTPSLYSDFKMYIVNDCGL